MTELESAAAVAIECLGSLVQGTLGFGVNLIAVPQPSLPVLVLPPRRG